MRWAGRVAPLIAPWIFVVALTWIWLGLLVPRALDGHLGLACLTLFAGLALTCFTLSAVTFSRDVLTGRWPGDRV